jgi:uncharacterized protein YacL
MYIQAGYKALRRENAWYFSQMILSTHSFICYFSFWSMHVVVMWRKVAITALEYICESWIPACLSVYYVFICSSNCKVKISKSRTLVIEKSLSYQIIINNWLPAVVDLIVAVFIWISLRQRPSHILTLLLLELPNIW